MEYEPCDKWKTKELGDTDSLNYRIIFIDQEGNETSLWRDIPLFSKPDLLHFVCKTPKGSRASYQVEIAEDDPSLKLSLRKGQLCSYATPAPWNIGMLPQTWSDPNQTNSGPFVGLLNDGQPIEVINISDSEYSVGSVYTVKPLVAFAVTNDVNLTWHIVAIDSNDPYCSYINDINDVDIFFPAILPRVRDWLQESYGEEDERAMILGQVKTSTEEMISVICRAHASWKLFSTIHLEWRQKSAEIMNYGKIVWENYTATDSKATLPALEQLTNSTLLYDMAWASSETELYDSSENEISCINEQWRRESCNNSKKRGLFKFWKNRMNLKFLN